MTNAFDLLSPSIRESLWQMQWQSLRPIQEQCIVDILQTPNDIVISAPTASGKTEAAFLPILSRISASSRNSIQAVYISPLKALINSQFARLSDLCSVSGIDVHRWHGDIAHNRKIQTIRNPTGVLLITPESLESLFVNRSETLSHLFCELEFIVIDEVHAFIGTERGLQLQNLICRLQRYTRRRPRCVALSATIGDLRNTAAWISIDSPESVICRTADSSDRRVRIQVRGYLIHAQSVEQVDPNATGSELDFDLFSLYWGRKSLIFTNARATAELLTDSLNGMARKQNRKETFLIHHGSLSAETRGETEAFMQSGECWQVVCSATLELGIDVGDVEATAQIGPCPSVNSMLQRMGRSGRRGGQPEMLVFVPCREPIAHGLDDSLLFPPLLQAIAVTELLLEGKNDLPAASTDDCSTLVQQLMSTIVEFGGLTADALYSALFRRGAFRTRSVPLLSEKEFMDLLRHIHAAGLIEQLTSGVLVLGPQGEREVRHRNFYAAFSADREFNVIFGSSSIGTISSSRLPNVGSALILAGKRWRVLGVDIQRQVVNVVPDAAGMSPYFWGQPADVSTEVRQRMRVIVSSTSVPDFLDDQATQILANARSSAKLMNLTTTVLCGQCGSTLRWFPWVGSRALLTIQTMLLAHGIDAKPSFHELSLMTNNSIEDLKTAAETIVAQRLSIEGLMSYIENIEVRKWDHFVPTDLLQRSFVNSCLNMEEATKCFQQLLELGLRNV